MSDNNQVEIRQDDVTYIERPYDEAMKQAEAVLQDERLAAAYKGEQVREIVEAAAKEIRDRGASTVERLTKELAELQGKTRLSAAPSKEEAAVLLYTRDALLARWASMDAPAMAKDWEAALAAGDKITAKVYADFAPSVINQRLGIKPSLASGLAGPFGELGAKTEDALLTADQKKARAEIKKIEATLTRAKMAMSGRAARLEQARIMNGKLVDGAMIASAQHIRSRF